VGAKMAPVVLRDRPSRTSPKTSAALCAAVLVLTLVLGACSGGSKHKSSPTTATTSPKVLTIRTATLKVGKVDIQTAGSTTVPIDTASGNAVLAVAQKYINRAVFVPLNQGIVGPQFADLFDSGIKPAAKGSDKLALTDLSVGKVASFSAKATPVALSALEGGLGELIYLATNFDLTVKAAAPSGPLTITRHIELTFGQTAKQWLITAYRVQTVRKSTAGTTTTTATGGATP
jgi:hypothetical protein